MGAGTAIRTGSANAFLVFVGGLLTVFGLLSDQTENQLSHFLCTRSQRKMYTEYERLYNAQYSERSVLQTEHLYLVQQVLTGDYILLLRGIHQKLY